MSKKAKKSVCVGIDLGTTNSCAATYQNGIPKIHQSIGHGEPTTPSIVAFKLMAEAPIVGKTATLQHTKYSKNTIRCVKRLMGLSYKDDHQQLADMLTYAITNVNGKVKIRIEYSDGQSELYAPEEISAMILEQMKSAMIHDMDAGEDVTIDMAVITVPAYFNDEQKKATRDAAIIAGFNPAKLTLITEPTAAAIAHGTLYECANTEEMRTTVVYDLGM